MAERSCENCGHEETCLWTDRRCTCGDDLPDWEPAGLRAEVERLRDENASIRAELRDRCETMDTYVKFPDTTRDADMETWGEDDFLEEFLGYCEGCGRLAKKCDGEGAYLCERCWDKMVEEYHRLKSEQRPGEEE